MAMLFSGDGVGAATNIERMPMSSSIEPQRYVPPLKRRQAGGLIQSPGRPANGCSWANEYPAALLPLIPIERDVGVSTNPGCIEPVTIPPSCKNGFSVGDLSRNCVGWGDGRPKPMPM